MPQILLKNAIVRGHPILKAPSSAWPLKSTILNGNNADVEIKRNNSFEVTMMDRINSNIAVVVLTLELMENDVIAAAMMGLTGFGNIPATNIAFKAFREANLIKETGYTTFETDVVIAALNFVVSNRHSKGLFK